METLRMNQKEMLETVAEMKNGFDGFTSRLNTAQERISELEYKLIETSQTEAQRDRRVETPQNIQKL